MAQSEVRGGDAKSNRDECGCDRGDLAPSPRSPRPEGSWSAHPPCGGVTIRYQEREPGPPLGPALRRHQLHSRSGARPRLPRDSEERKN